MNPQDLMNSWFSGAAGSSTAGQKTVAQMAPAPKAPDFFSQVGSSISKIAPAIPGAILHGITDPFAHLFQNNINAAGQGGRADSIESKRAALDARSHDLLKAYSSKQITRDQYNQESKKQMAEYQGLQDSAQSNIDSVKSTAQMLPDAISAIGTVATLGAGGLEAGAVKGALTKVGGVAGAKVAKVAGTVGKVVDDTIGSGRTGGVVSQLAKGITKNAVVTQPTIQFAGQSAHDVATGNVKGAAVDAALALAPAGIGALGKGAKAVLPGIKDALHGTSATLTDAFGVGKVKNFLAENANNPDAINTLKQMEMFSEDQPAVKNGKISAGQFMINHFATALNTDTKTASLDEITNKFATYAHNDAKLQAWLKENPAGKNVVLSHDFTASIPAVAERLKAVEGADASTRIKVANQALDDMGIKNPSIRDKVGGMLLSGSTTKDIQAALKQHAIIPVPKGTLDKGYIATYGPNKIAHLPSSAEAQAAGMPVVGSDPHGFLGGVGKALNKSGFGIQTTASTTTQALITKNLDARLAKTDMAGKGHEIMNILHDATSKTRGIFDPRLLRATTSGIIPGAVNIEHELGVTPKVAKQVLKAVKGAYTDIPLGTRSFGEKATDLAIQKVPGMANFLKAQGYGKFSMNPFFYVKQATKSEFIGQTETGGKALNIGRALNSIMGTAPQTETMDILRRGGYLSKAGSAGGEADFLGNLAPELGAKVSGPEVSGFIQQSMGQAAEQFAKNNGVSVADIMKNEGEPHALKGELDNLLQMIVGYPKGDNYLNTNLAKSLNVLVFPSRFETKVAMATAHYFMAQPKVTQLALINGALKASAWADSSEGKQWQKDNADLMGIVNYFSPTHSIDAVLNTLKSGNVGDLGQVGGMPFGVITTILKNQGVALPGQVTGSDTNPATGEAYVQKLPTTEKARIQQGITDVIGQMFSYPGATVGLASKTSLIQQGPLKINPKEQTVVKPTGSVSPLTSKALPSFTPAKVKDMNLPKVDVAPIYKHGLPKARKGKTLARRPGTF